MDFRNRRLWYVVAAVIVLIIIIGYAAGWFGGEAVPPVTPE